MYPKIFPRVLQRVMVNSVRSMLTQSINHKLNKKLIDRYSRLQLPQDKIFATYIWIDGSGINMRSKDRILSCAPCKVNELPWWSFDGSSTGMSNVKKSDALLKPVALYKDPFRMEPHVMVLCETYFSDGKPTPTNNRKYLMDQMEKHRGEEPWFGLEQECAMLDVDGWGLGWPKAGYTTTKHKFSYCGVGAKYVVGRDISEVHARCCLYSGLDFEGTNAEVMFGAWEWQIGISAGEKAADDLWISRYLMCRVAEDYGVQVTYHPKPLGPDQPSLGMHHNFSTNSMRAEGGFKIIESCMEKLEKNHQKHIDNYGLGNGKTNLLRLTGEFETSSADKFSWGIGDRSASVRIKHGVKTEGKGYFEDRRPAADCDPYLVCGLLMETCLD